MWLGGDRKGVGKGGGERICLVQAHWHHNFPNQSINHPSISTPENVGEVGLFSFQERNVDEDFVFVAPRFGGDAFSGILRLYPATGKGLNIKLIDDNESLLMIDSMIELLY